MTTSQRENYRSCATLDEKYITRSTQHIFPVIHVRIRFSVSSGYQNCYYVSQIDCLSGLSG